MGMKLNSRSIWLAVLVIVVLASLMCTNAERADAEAASQVTISSSSSFGSCNDSTADSGCAGGGGEEEEEMEMEFLMDSEVNRRLLAGGTTQSLAGRALQPPSICDARRIGSCIGKRTGSKKQCSLSQHSCRGQDPE